MFNIIRDCKDDGLGAEHGNESGHLSTIGDNDDEVAL